ncbi:MAG: hypothetical protein AAF355_09610 [Myxococcota bacterium]
MDLPFAHAIFLFGEARPSDEAGEFVLRSTMNVTLSSPRWLIAPYVINILILVPVCYQMLFGRGVSAVFDGLVPESAGLRMMVGALWSAILFASLAGLLHPKFFALILLIQVFYKALWLGLFILPLWRLGAPLPSGITWTFIFIVLTYPIFYGFALRD